MSGRLALSEPDLQLIVPAFRNIALRACNDDKDFLLGVQAIESALHYANELPPSEDRQTILGILQKDRTDILRLVAASARQQNTSGCAALLLMVCGVAAVLAVVCVLN